MRSFLLLLAAGLLAPGWALGEIQLEPVEYTHDGTELRGVLAHDAEITDRRPGVLVVHDWMGISDETRRRARMLAELGYVAFAADIYGAGSRPSNTEEAAAQSSKYKSDRALLRGRLAAALAVLAENERCDPGRIGVIGYCFGGMSALEVARMGADVAGVVSFHGNLDTPSPEDAEQIQCKVLVLHGADDPFVLPGQVAAFMDEMRSAEVDWQMVHYGNAVHSFTNPGAAGDPVAGAKYDAKADARSWVHMKAFFDEIFAR